MFEQTTHFDKWLALSPLLYNRLIIHPASYLKYITHVKWLRGIHNKKSSFSYNEGYACLAGSTQKISKSNNLQGGLSIYKCSVQISEELDDDRLMPNLKLHSHWPFKEEIYLIQQYGNNNQDTKLNNMFAITYKNSPILNLLSTRKLFEQGIHSSYVQSDKCIQFSSHTQSITSIKWANIQTGGHKLFTSSDDSTIIQYDIQKIVQQRQLKYHRASIKGITPIYDYSSDWSTGPCIKPSSPTLISISTDGTIYIWDQSSSTPMTRIISKQKQLSAIQCLSQHIFVTGTNDGSVKIWDLRYFKQYTYNTKLDITHGHTAKINSIKANRFNSQNDKTNNKNGQLPKIRFTTSADDGKIIQWHQKLQFIHQPHINYSTFDLSDNQQLCLSAQSKKNIFMLWQPGIYMGQNQN